MAEAVVRRAGCRVLTVPPASAGTPGVAHTVIEQASETTACAVCAGPSQGDLICEACRARIRGEALERKRTEECAGRR